VGTGAISTSLTDGDTAATAGSGDDGGPYTSATLVPPAPNREGIYALDKADIFNLLVLPPPNPGGEVGGPDYGKAAAYCAARRAMLLVDPPLGAVRPDQARTLIPPPALFSNDGKNAAVFYPRIKAQNPFNPTLTEDYPPTGAVAGVFARTDGQRGVWKAPAGLEATLAGVSGLSYTMTDDENGDLNPLGINCLRTFPFVGQVVWGARTRDGADALASEWKYIPVRRIALYIEESLYRGLKWVVFEPNDEPLWAQIRLNVGAFMNNLFRQGAFQGSAPREAYFVKCDRETTTQNDINLGIVNILVGFAPLKPAEFVILKLQQMAGQIAV
jgi:phage tail sheath protein FI